MQSKTAGGAAGDAGIPVLGLAAGKSVRLGQVVRSVQGRDRNRWYVVVKEDKEGFFYVADGSRRPIARPKRKNPKHLLLYERVLPVFDETGTGGPRMSDKELQQALDGIASSFAFYGEEVDDAGKT